MSRAYSKLNILEKVKQRRQGIIFKQNISINMSYYYEDYKQICKTGNAVFFKSTYLDYRNDLTLKDLTNHDYHLLVFCLCGFFFSEARIKSS